MDYSPSASWCLAVGETVILLPSPLHPYRNAYYRKREVQQNDSLADGFLVPVAAAVGFFTTFFFTAGRGAGFASLESMHWALCR